ncbi:MAG: ATP-binding cassette domain-containing protein, partial [Stellaceae bacterium]
MAEAAAARLLAVQDLVKTFGPVRAVDGVSITIAAGEVLGIIGDNGAGKSTFLSLLTGFHRPDSGRILYRGRQVSISSPAVARHVLGIEMIYQKLELAPDLTAAENLFLGEEMRRFGLFKARRAMRERAAAVLGALNTKIRPDDFVGELSGGEQQVVAIGRALLFERRIVIMDEPTAAISVQKVEDVLALIKKLKEAGKTV